MSNADKSRILIVSYTQSNREPRVLKQVSEFSKHWHVTTAGYGESPRGVHAHIELDRAPRRRGFTRIPGLFSLLLLLRLHAVYERLEARNRSTLALLGNARWDVVVAHDAQTLAVATRLSPKFGVLADMHEYAPKQSAPTLLWRLLYEPYYRWICRTFAAHAAAITTVSPGIVDEYRREFGIDAHLVVNAAPYCDIDPSPVSRPIRLVHSGGAAPDRRLETLVDAVVSSSADVTLDFYLVDDDSGYLKRLAQVAAQDSRVRFNEPVPYDRLAQTLAEYDVGLHLIAPTSFNNYWSLPNKFFDYVQARLGVVIGPSPAMVDLLERYGFGTVAAGFDSDDLKDVLERMTCEDVERWKAASHKVARDLSGEAQARIWGRIVGKMVTAPDEGIAS